jgi:hypothetical protein
MRAGPAVPRQALAEAPHCHVPAALDPEQRKALERHLRRLIGTVAWLEQSVRAGRESDLTPAQVAVIEHTLRDVVATLVDGHFRLRGWCDRARTEPGGCGTTAWADSIHLPRGLALTSAP